MKSSECEGIVVHFCYVAILVCRIAGTCPGRSADFPIHSDFRYTLLSP